MAGTPLDNVSKQITARYDKAVALIHDDRTVAIALLEELAHEPFLPVWFVMHVNVSLAWSKDATEAMPHLLAAKEANTEIQNRWPIGTLSEKMQQSMNQQTELISRLEVKLPSFLARLREEEEGAEEHEEHVRQQQEESTEGSGAEEEEDIEYQQEKEHIERRQIGKAQKSDDETEGEVEDDTIGELPAFPSTPLREMSLQSHRYPITPISSRPQQQQETGDEQETLTPSLAQRSVRTSARRKRDEDPGEDPNSSPVRRRRTEPGT